MQLGLIDTWQHQQGLHRQYEPGDLEIIEHYCLNKKSKRPAVYWAWHNIMSYISCLTASVATFNVYLWYSQAPQLPWMSFPSKMTPSIYDFCVYIFKYMAFCFPMGAFVCLWWLCVRLWGLFVCLWGLCRSPIASIGAPSDKRALICSW